MAYLIDLLIIACLWVFVLDLSGFIDHLEAGLSRWLGVRCRIPRPFSCSLCMTWWTGLAYLLIVNKLMLLPVLGLAFFSFSTSLIYQTAIFLRESAEILIAFLGRLIRKLDNVF